MVPRVVTVLVGVVAGRLTTDQAGGPFRDHLGDPGRHDAEGRPTRCPSGTGGGHLARCPQWRRRW